MPWPHVRRNTDGVPVDDVEHFGAGRDPDGVVIGVCSRRGILVVVCQDG